MPSRGWELYQNLYNEEPLQTDCTCAFCNPISWQGRQHSVLQGPAEGPAEPGAHTPLCSQARRSRSLQERWRGHPESPRPAVTEKGEGNSCPHTCPATASSSRTASEPGVLTEPLPVSPSTAHNANSLRTSLRRLRSQAGALCLGTPSRGDIRFPIL